MSGFLGVLAAQGLSTALVAPGYAANYSLSRATTCSIRLVLSNAGTWLISVTGGAGGALTGTPASGNWASGTLFVGGYEYFVTTSGATVTGTASNTPTSSGWLPINSTAVFVAVSSGSASASEAIATYKVDIREISGDGYIQSASLSFDALAL